MIEYCSSPFISMFLLAERVYSSQLKFIGSRYEVIENKAIIPNGIRSYVSNLPDKMIFLYSGTIASHYGIFEAIQFIHKMHRINNHIELRIVGFAPDNRVYKKLLKSIDECGYIKIEGGDHLISHNQILKEIQFSDFCLLPYRKNKGSEGRIPTKLFECLALEIPVIISPNPAWDSLIHENNAGIIYDFIKDDLPKENLFRQSFYGNNLSQNYLWDAEAKVLSTAVERLI
jgi:glycosyltransferase involved in cell wall biosynthesis